jgi:hypothetical protein
MIWPEKYCPICERELVRKRLPVDNYDAWIHLVQEIFSPR